MDHVLLDQLDHMIAQCERVLAQTAPAPRPSTAAMVQQLLDGCRALRALLIEAETGLVDD
jgi:hypothetical protein